MLGKAVAFAIATAACLAAPGSRAQDPAGDDDLTAEQMIEVAREEWRTVEPKGCPVAKPGEIVVCKPDSQEFRVESPTDEAISKGEPMPDGIPRAPYVLGLPECGVEVQCMKMGRTPTPPLMIDLSAIPIALTEAEAALVSIDHAISLSPEDAGLHLARGDMYGSCSFAVAAANRDSRLCSCKVFSDFVAGDV